MKQGWDFKTGLNRNLTSWKSSDDPSAGDYSYGVELHGLPQIVLRMGSKVLYRSGMWYQNQFSGSPVLMANSVFKPIFIDNAEEVYFTYESVDAAIISRQVISQSGLVQHLRWIDEQSQWTSLFTVQKDQCDTYNLCGPFGTCYINQSPNCKCMKSFTPKSLQDWVVFDTFGGCVRTSPLDCGEGEGFEKYTLMKLPDTSDLWVKKNVSTKECEAECLRNCSCTAYAEMDPDLHGNGCLTWRGNLIDMRHGNRGYGQDLYVRVSASEMTDQVINNQSYLTNQSPEEESEFPFFSLSTIAAATNNFSLTNKIGEGGFGPVYKGVLPIGQEIAVKRLSLNSGQGLKELKNEVSLISKLQHRNLVKILGCCVDGEERMLIYEYMANQSLDVFIFGWTLSPFSCTLPVLCLVQRRKRK